MGNCHLTLANYWLGKVDAAEDEQSETKTELNEEETKASEQLTKGRFRECVLCNIFQRLSTLHRY